MADARKFSEALINHDALLASALEFIADECEPGEVFSEEKLVEWAQARGWTPPPAAE